VRALDSGGVVIFPTDTVYGLLARKDFPEAVKKIYELKGRSDEKPLVRMVASLDPEDALLKTLPERAWRVLQALCPGALTVAGQSRDSLRYPQHEDLCELLTACGGEVLCTSANLSGEKDAIELSDVPKKIRAGVQALHDAGACPGGEASTVIRFSENDFEVLREGPIKENLLRYLWCYRLAFVCTGNTCRSPMAEAMARDLLAKTYKTENLIQSGVFVESAGIHASAGAAASGHSLEVMKSMGLDISEHVSGHIGHFMLYPPDKVYGMTASHVQALKRMNLNSELLSLSGEDVKDPFGGALSEYQACADQMKELIDQRIADWAIDFARSGS
jgi:L-threonylcarbamoyladenylate synthase